LVDSKAALDDHDVQTEIRLAGLISL
jgi:hypothetical protein